MSSSLPAISTGASLPAATAQVIAKATARELTGGSPELNRLADAISGAGSAAERADKHVQKWREGMAKMTLEVAFADDPALDEAFRLIQRTGAWKILVAACLESPTIMAELRAYWNPEDKVEIR